jgi:hypothetical protein
VAGKLGGEGIGEVAEGVDVFDFDLVIGEFAIR